MILHLFQKRISISYERTYIKPEIFSPVIVMAYQVLVNHAHILHFTCPLVARISQHELLWGGGSCTWSGGGGVPDWGGVPGLGGYLAQGVYLVRLVYMAWGCTWSGECTWSRGCTWSGGVPGPRGGVPSPEVYLPRYSPLWTEWQTGAKILPCPKLRLRALISRR